MNISMTQKTYKRETAAALLGILIGFGAWGAYGNPAAIEVAKLLALPFVLFGMGAFGLDAVAKQLQARSQ